MPAVRLFVIVVIALAIYDLLWWLLLSNSILVMHGDFAHAFIYPLILPAVLILGLIIFFSKGWGDAVAVLALSSGLVFCNGLVTGCTMFLAPLERCT